MNYQQSPCLIDFTKELDSEIVKTDDYWIQFTQRFWDPFQNTKMKMYNNAQPTDEDQNLCLIYCLNASLNPRRMIAINCIYDNQ